MAGMPFTFAKISLALALVLLCAIAHAQRAYPYKPIRLIAGETLAAFVSTLSAGSMRSRVRVLAVTTLQRDPSMPDYDKWKKVIGRS